MGETLSTGELNVDSGELLRAAGDLDRLANELERGVAAHRSSLVVPAAGRDEVSTTAAATFGSVAETFSGTAAAGVHELRKIAAVLRAQARDFGTVEADIEESFRL
jgi:uncharacterized protein YukE